MIAREDRIWAAVVEAPERYGKTVDPWERNILGQDLSPARRMAVNDIQRVRLTSEQLLTEPQLWATLDYASVENPDFQGVLNCTVKRGGIGHGFVAWFETDLADGVSFSNAPGAPEAIYASIFFPWLNPVPLAAGQAVCVDLQAKLLERDYFWRWTTHVKSAQTPAETVVHFDQSQLQGTMLSPAKLRKSASDFVPRLSENGRMQQRALELMDGKASLDVVARRLTTEFPQRFDHWHHALTYASALSRELSQ